MRWTVSANSASSMGLFLPACTHTHIRTKTLIHTHSHSLTDSSVSLTLTQKSVSLTLTQKLTTNKDMCENGTAKKDKKEGRDDAGGGAGNDNDGRPSQRHQRVPPASQAQVFQAKGCANRFASLPSSSPQTKHSKRNLLSSRLQANKSEPKFPS